MFKFDAANKSFEEEEARRICLGDEDQINYSEFDGNIENIFILKNLKVLEKRTIGAMNETLSSFELEKKAPNYFLFLKRAAFVSSAAKVHIFL